MTEPSAPSGSWPPASSSRSADPSNGSPLAAPRVDATRTPRPFVVDLCDELALDPALVGVKAAVLARAARGGLKTLPGVVLTTPFSDAIDTGTDTADHPAVRDAFERADGRRRDLVARSSSVVEDTSESSMAGQFESVIGIGGFDEFVTAVRAVLDSRQRAGAADQPIAVLVPPLIEPAFGGVTFGIDPVSGRTDRLIVTAIISSVSAHSRGTRMGRPSPSCTPP